MRQGHGDGTIGDMNIGYIATVLGVILVSMMLHELMHGFVAYRLGDDTARLLGRLSFNPLRHIDPYMTIMIPLLIVITNSLTGASMPIFGGAKPVPFNPANIEHEEWGVALLSIAGPLVNLVLAFVCFGIFTLSHLESTSVIGQILSVSVMVNLGFFVFNILPIPPLDGSRVIYALAPDFVRHGLDVIERYGIILVMLIVFVFNDAIATYITGMITLLLQAFGAIFGVAIV